MMCVDRKSQDAQSTAVDEAKMQVPLNATE
jgi:hypothetical protein